MLLKHRPYRAPNWLFVVGHQHRLPLEDGIAHAFAQEVVGAKNAARSGDGTVEEFVDLCRVLEQALCHVLHGIVVTACQQRARVLSDLIERTRSLAAEVGDDDAICLAALGNEHVKDIE